MLDVAHNDSYWESTDLSHFRQLTDLFANETLRRRTTYAGERSYGPLTNIFQIFQNWHTIHSNTQRTDKPKNIQELVEESAKQVHSTLGQLLEADHGLACMQLRGYTRSEVRRIAERAFEEITTYIDEMHELALR